MAVDRVDVAGCVGFLRFMCGVVSGWTSQIPGTIIFDSTMQSLTLFRPFQVALIQKEGRPMPGLLYEADVPRSSDRQVQSFCRHTIASAHTSVFCR
jgi:hypothetical protein